MRVLQLVSRFGIAGGIESYVARLSEKLTTDGHLTTVVTSDLPSGRPKAAGQTGYDVVLIAGFVHSIVAPAREAEERVLEFAARFDPDIVVSHHTGSARLLLDLNTNYPTVELVHTLLCGGGKLFRRGDRICTRRVGAHCLRDWYLAPCGIQRSPLAALQSHVRTLRQIDALKRLTAVLVGSEFMRRYLVAEGLAPERLFVVDLTTGIAPERALRIGERALTGSAVNVLFVGRVVYNKGIQYALRALARMDEMYRLIVVGDGYYRESLAQLAAKLGVAHRVDFTGFLDGEALANRYRHAAVMVVPSLLPEPAGLVVPEARAHGLPVVVFDVGGLKEWADRYDGIYVAAPADVASLACQIARAASASPASARTVSAPPAEPVDRILERVAGVGETR